MKSKVGTARQIGRHLRRLSGEVCGVMTRGSRVRLPHGALLALLIVCACIPKSTTAPGTDQREIGIDVASPKPVVTTGAVQGPMSMETAAILTRIEKVETSMTAIGVQVSKTYYHASASHHNKGVNEWAIVVVLGLLFISRDFVAWINRRRNGKRRRTLFQN